MLAGLSEWLDAYGRAWESRDAQAVDELFTEDAVYQRGPFGQKLRGRIMIREAWAEAFETQPTTKFGYEVLTATGNGGIVRWWSSTDEQKLEGILRLAFDETGMCNSLEAWWNASA